MVRVLQARLGLSTRRPPPRRDASHGWPREHNDPFSTDRFRRDSVPLWWLEAVCRHACASREGRYCSLSRNRIGPAKLEEGSITFPFCVISSTPSQANCTAMRRASGMSGRHAAVRARGASEGQHVFVRPRFRTSSSILASSASSASGLLSASSFSSRRRLGIVVGVRARKLRVKSADRERKI